MAIYGKDHIDTVNKRDFIQIKKFGSDNPIWTPLSRLLKAIDANTDTGLGSSFDYYWYASNNDGVTPPVDTPSADYALAFFENGWIWEWDLSQGWVALGQLASNLPFEYDVVWFATNNDGVTPPVYVPTVNTLGIYKNGHFWEWDSVNGWVYLGQITTGTFNTTSTDFVWINSNANPNTTPNFTPTVTTLAIYKNGYFFEWQPQHGWQLLGKLSTGGGGGGGTTTDYYWYNTNNNGVTPPVDTPTADYALAFFANGWVWEWTLGAGWVVLGQLPSGSLPFEYDVIWLSGNNDGVTPPAFTPTVPTLAIYDNGHFWEWDSVNGWVYLGQVTGGQFSADDVDFIFYASSNDGLTAPVATPTKTTLAIFENGWFWEWHDGFGWTVLGQIDIPITPGTDFVWIASNNDGVTSPGTTPTETTLAIYQNGWFWEWKGGSWVVLGQLVIPSTFLSLTDTPSSYTGQAGNVPTVNTGETALEFLPRGDSWFWGTTALAPLNTVGNNGDEWVTTAGRIYEKVAGSWVLKDDRLVDGNFFQYPLINSGYDFVLREKTGFGQASGVESFYYNGLLNNSIIYSGTSGAVDLNPGQFKHIMYLNYSGALTLRFPASSGSNDNVYYIVKNINTGTATFTKALINDSVTTFEGATTYTLLPGQSVALQYIHSETNWRVLWKYDANAPAAIDTFIGLTDTPSTYTAKALPVTNEAADALIWSNMFYTTTGGKTWDIYPDTNNKNIITFRNTSGTEKGSIYLSAIGNVRFRGESVHGLPTASLFLAGNNGTGGNLYPVSIASLSVATNNSLAADGNWMFDNANGSITYTGSGTITVFGNKFAITMSTPAESGANITFVQIDSSWAFTSRTTANTISQTIILGVKARYKNTQVPTSDTSTFIVKGHVHIVDEPFNYIDRESVIVNEIDKQAGMDEFGFYAHKSNGGIFKQPLPTYADNDAAIAGGLTTDMWYKTSTGEVRIVV